jgi:hypothetical protein
MSSAGAIFAGVRSTGAVSPGEPRTELILAL